MDTILSRRPRITVAPEGHYWIVQRNGVVVGRYDTEAEAIQHRRYASALFARRTNQDARRQHHIRVTSYACDECGSTDEWVHPMTCSRHIAVTQSEISAVITRHAPA